MTTSLSITVTALFLTGLLAIPTSAAVTYSTDSFGTGGNSFNIQFASIGNAGNGNDAGAGGGIYSSPYGGVSYQYRMGVTEVPQDWIAKATNLGLANVTAGPWTGNRPAANMTWYEAAAFVNYLNTSTGHQAAYQLNGTATGLTPWTSGQAWQTGGENLYRHKDAYYFLPSQDEWYKAAYHKNDGVTANYWDYAAGSNTIPIAVAGGTAAGTVVFNQSAAQGPAAVNNAGGLSPYGTIGQDGNVSDWLESAGDGLNDSGAELRTLRSGVWNDSEFNLRSSVYSDDVFPLTSVDNLGFRVASIEPIPEPAGILTGLLCLSVAVLRRRRASAH